MLIYSWRSTENHISALSKLFSANGVGEVRCYVVGLAVLSRAVGYTQRRLLCSPKLIISGYNIKMEHEGLKTG